MIYEQKHWPDASLGERVIQFMSQALQKLALQRDFTYCSFEIQGVYFFSGLSVLCLSLKSHLSTHASDRQDSSQGDLLNSLKYAFILRIHKGLTTLENE